jgi:ElaB/YqjD/DUF883 family membrane-anchored ribosome-binding protein
MEMAAAKSMPGEDPTMASANRASSASPAQLEADIAQLREDIAKLAAQLKTTQEHGYGAAKRAASDGVEHIKAQGEAAIENIRSSARDIEEQIVTSVREKPVTALAMAAGLGYFLALLNRR